MILLSIVKLFVADINIRARDSRLIAEYYARSLNYTNDWNRAVVVSWPELRMPECDAYLVINIPPFDYL